MRSFNTPNIFDYATSELSQDAFLLWLINYAKSDSASELSAIGKNFILFLLQTYSDSFDFQFQNKLCQSLKVTGIERQKKVKYKGCNKFIDVFFTCEVNDKKYAVIIEDKTNSKPHSEQLIAYALYVSKQEPYKDHKLVNIYFKTGYIFEDELKGCEKAEYAVLDIAKLAGFLEQESSENTIFIDYKAYIFQMYLSRQSHLNLLNPRGNSNPENSLSKGYVQYELLKRLREKTIFKQYALVHGTSLGKPYSELRIARFPETYGKKSEFIFLRIEKMKSGVAITLRQYANIKNDEKKFKELKKQRLAKLKELNVLAFDEIENSLSLSKVMKDNKGANSSQVMMLLVQNNTLQDLFETLPKYIDVLDELLKKDYVSEFNDIVES